MRADAANTAEARAFSTAAYVIREVLPKVRQSFGGRAYKLKRWKSAKKEGQKNGRAENEKMKKRKGEKMEEQKNGRAKNEKMEGRKDGRAKKCKGGK